MIRRHFSGRMGRDQRGVALSEFALILPALCVLLLGIFDLGYRAYAASVVQGALHEAARMATVGGVSMPQIDAAVRTKLSHFATHSTVETETKSYYDFTAVRRPEKITSDTAPTGQYNPGDCFEDANGNKTYDLDRGRTGLGNADDIVRYQIQISYTRMMPLHKFIGGSPTETIIANTVLRNQPFAGRSNSSVIVCTPPAT